MTAIVGCFEEDEDGDEEGGLVVKRKVMIIVGNRHENLGNNYMRL